MAEVHEDHATESDGAVKFDARLAEGVAYFEQMLEIMPEDRTTLEFLVVAYDQLGQHEKGQKSLVELTKLLIKEKDIPALQGLLPRLESSDYEPAKALCLKVTTLVGPMPDLTPEAPRQLTDEELRSRATLEAVRSELALLEQLHEAGVVSAELRERIRENVQSSPIDGRVFLISALHILEKENPTVCEKAIEYLADKYAVTPIPLAAFEPGKDLFVALPPLLAQLRGVVPFAKLGNLMLIVVLNPADDKLREKLESIGPCRFYIADPASVEAAIEKVYGAVV